VDGLSIGADGKLADEAAGNQLEDRIRILLPLTLPPPLAMSENGGPAMQQLERSLSTALNKGLLAAVLSASQQGEQAVMDAMASVIGAALVIEDEK
jgi:hypothetical protein